MQLDWCRAGKYALRLEREACMRKLDGVVQQKPANVREGLGGIRAMWR